ncbi:MAG: hypothetical protein CVU13_05490 [Bacteroidetes bacterium HGW-Bacteroidetes-8]|jgi:hypothetical protein|nr:MAG: hypothetical protein CVU13_05490 [Bacteroidetes bacterium HGW-Bacteroidetes-8]
MSTYRVEHKFFLLLLLINIFVTKISFAQFYSLGTDPSRAKWRSIETENFKVIYPEQIDSLAKRYLFLLERLREPVLASLKTDPKKMDVVLHPFSSASNGMVGVAPKRMELITRPPANNDYSHNWEKHLVIHEMRHTGHVSKFEKGIFKPLSWLLGEQATALGVGVLMSRWKLEGDAVVTETELTSAGRGRDPDHLIYYRAAFLEGDYRNWDKWTMGSYKNYVPDVYSFGYMFCSFVRFNSSNYNYMGEATDYLISRFYDISADNKAYKKTTSLSKKENFRELKRVMTQKWRREDSARIPFTPYRAINNKNSDYTSYLYPLPYSGDTVFAVKSGLKQIKRLVAISQEGQERLLRHMGRISSPLTIFGDKLYWTEFVQSGRWELENFSEIYSYDIKSGKTNRHTKGESFYNLHFSQNGDTVMVISYPVEGSSEILLLRGDDFSNIGKISSPQRGQFKEVVQIKGGLFATVITEKGMGLFSYDRRLDLWKREIEEQSKYLSNLRVKGDDIWFVSDLNGNNNVYSYNPELKDLRQLTNSRFGVSSLSLVRDSSLFYYSDFAYGGYNIVKASEDSMLWRSSNFSLPKRDDIAEYLSLGAGFNTDTVRVPDNPQYESNPYSKVKNLFRIHSWAPVYYNIDNIKNLTYESVYDLVSPGFIIYSQNTLSTANTLAGYSWRKGFHSGHLKFTYRGLFPVIDIKADFNDRDRYNNRLVTLTDEEPVQKRDTISGSPFISTQLMVYLPLHYGSGGWSSGVVPRVLWRYTNDSFFSYKNGRLSNYQYINLGVSLYKILNLAVRDIFPRYGIGTNIQFSAVPFAGENYGSLIYSSVYGYLPGLIPNHGIKIAGAFQKQFFEGKNYLMTNSISFPDGYEQRFSRWAASLKFEYALPLLMRDISLSTLLYIKRVQMIPFVHFFRNGGVNQVENLFSLGSDLLLDLNLIGISYPLTAGIRLGVTGEKKYFTEFLFQTPL